MAVIGPHHAEPADQLPWCCRFPPQEGHVIEHGDTKRRHGQDQLTASRDQIGWTKRWRCAPRPLGIHHGIEIAANCCVQRAPDRERDNGDDRRNDCVVDDHSECPPPPGRERNTVGSHGRLQRTGPRSRIGRRPGRVWRRVAPVRSVPVASGRRSRVDRPRVAGPLPAVPVAFLCRVDRVRIPATRRGVASGRGRRRAYRDVRHLLIVVSS
jgi:hypothetical protein